MVYGGKREDTHDLLQGEGMVRYEAALSMSGYIVLHMIIWLHALPSAYSDTCHCCRWRCSQQIFPWRRQFDGDSQRFMGREEAKCLFKFSSRYIYDLCSGNNGSFHRLYLVNQLAGSDSELYVILHVYLHASAPWQVGWPGRKLRSFDRHLVTWGSWQFAFFNRWLKRSQPITDLY
jgi:hypothetical protein